MLGAAAPCWRAGRAYVVVRSRASASSAATSSARLLFGLGWGIADACPGPIATQIGQGVPWAVFTFAGMSAACGGSCTAARDRAATDAPGSAGPAGAAARPPMP